MKKLTYKNMLEAMLTRDVSYNGKFFIGVRTTRIYCLPSCKAKMPLLKNIIFFRDREEAIRRGFRGCKRCKAEYYPNVAPPWLEEVISFMRQEVNNKLDESKLVELTKVDISTIRRYFKLYFQTTPMAFHRKLRLTHAKKLLEEGVDYLKTTYECGFESPSGFRDAFVKEYGLPPGKYYAKR